VPPLVFSVLCSGRTHSCCRGSSFSSMGTPIKMSHVQGTSSHQLLPFSQIFPWKFTPGGTPPFLKGIVSAILRCMQGLADIWPFRGVSSPIQLDDALTIRFRLPRTFLKAEIERFMKFLESNVGGITPHNLKASIQLFNEIRRKLQEILNDRPNGLRESLAVTSPGWYGRYLWIARDISNF